jgi:hypothetical protein
MYIYVVCLGVYKGAHNWRFSFSHLGFAFILSIQLGRHAHEDSLARAYKLNVDIRGNAPTSELIMVI